MDKALEQVLAYHCAPALAGMKPANLISCPQRELPRWRALGLSLQGKGIRLRVLCCCERHALLLVYRPKVMRTHLQRAEVRAYLQREGYPGADMEAALQHLEQRLAGLPSFPHEAGIFLGYPPEDVEGFRRYGGRCCKLCGYWKVYGDERRAQATFARYTRCRDDLCRLMAQGLPLARILPPA